MTREPIYAALFALGQSVGSFTTKSRILKHWADVSQAETPALFQSQKDELATQQRGTPPKWDGGVTWYIYLDGSDQNPPSVLLNTILDAVEKALAPPPAQDVQTLGGLVSHCWVEGPIQTDEGTLGTRAVALVSIKFLAA